MGEKLENASRFPKNNGRVLDLFLEGEK